MRREREEEKREYKETVLIRFPILSGVRMLSVTFTLLMIGCLRSSKRGVVVVAVFNGGGMTATVGVTTLCNGDLGGGNAVVGLELPTAATAAATEESATRRRFEDLVT
jgi:hypothetical protein